MRKFIQTCKYSSQTKKKCKRKSIETKIETRTKAKRWFNQHDYNHKNWKEKDEKSAVWIKKKSETDCANNQHVNLLCRMIDEFRADDQPRSMGMCFPDRFLSFCCVQSGDDREKIHNCFLLKNGQKENCSLKNWFTTVHSPFPWACSTGFDSRVSGSIGWWNLCVDHNQIEPTSNAMVLS